MASLSLANSYLARIYQELANGWFQIHGGWKNMLNHCISFHNQMANVMHHNWSYFMLKGFGDDNMSEQKFPIEWKV